MLSLFSSIELSHENLNSFSFCFITKVVSIDGEFNVKFSGGWFSLFISLAVDYTDLYKSLACSNLICHTKFIEVYLNN